MDRKFIVLISTILLVFSLVGCSIVFEAGISGKVYTKDGTNDKAVSNVSVFAYTKKADRDSDFTKFENGNITRPSEESGYVSTSYTNENGEFTVNKIVWEAKSSEFGKTADVENLEFIFYHQDYKLAKAEASIISGSTNSNNIYQELILDKDFTTVNLTVQDVSTGKQMTSASTLKYELVGSSKEDSLNVTGLANFTVSYKKGTSPNLKLSLSNDGSHWVMTDKDGNEIPNYTIDNLKDGVKSVTLYMKNNEITLPAFSGNIDNLNFDTNPTNAKDGIVVWLEYKDINGTWVAFEETKNAGRKTSAEERSSGDTIKFYHGRFSGIGNNDNYSIVINKETYPDIIDWDNLTGKNIVLKLRLAFGFSPIEYYEFDYSTLVNSNLDYVKSV